MFVPWFVTSNDLGDTPSESTFDIDQQSMGKANQREGMGTMKEGTKDQHTKTKVIKESCSIWVW